MEALTARANRSLNRVCAAFQLQMVSLAAPARALDRKFVGRMMFLAGDTLRTIGSPSRGTPILLSDHLYLRELATEDTLRRIEGVMGVDDADTLARQLDPLVSDLVTALDSPRLPNTVASDFGVVRFIDYLRASIVLVTDLSLCATGSARTPTIAESIRALAGVLTERYPGHSIEVRVPPHVAVQVGAFDDGPTHTRGTPPNVIEANPRTFLELATGRQSWQQLIDSGQLTSSGVHAGEAARMFPVFRIPRP